MLYLAYGSNLNTAQMHFRCPGAVPVGRVDLPDHRLVFRGSKTGSFLSVDRAKGQTVPCVAWRLAPGNEASLDMYEGFPTFYRKHYARVPVRMFGRKGPTVTCRCMWYALPESSPLGAPSRAYYQVCFEGYQYFGLPTEKLRGALESDIG